MFLILIFCLLIANIEHNNYYVALNLEKHVYENKACNVHVESGHVLRWRSPRVRFRHELQT